MMIFTTPAFWIVVVCAVCFTAWVRFSAGRDWDDSIFIGTVIGGFVPTMVITFLCAITEPSVPDDAVYQDIPSETKQIYSLRNDKDIHGEYSSSFFIGSGYIDEERVYVTYVQEDMGIIQKTLKADITYLKEDLPAEAKQGVLTRKGMLEEEIAFHTWLTGRSGVHWRKCRWILHVPKGTIVQKFEVK
jgi:hypothetical protein